MISIFKRSITDVIFCKDSLDTKVRYVACDISVTL